VHYIEQGVHDCPAYHNNEKSAYPAFAGGAVSRAAKPKESHHGKAPTRLNRPGRRVHRDRGNVDDESSSRKARKVTVEVWINRIHSHRLIELTRFRKAVARSEMMADSKWPARKSKHPRSRVPILISFAVGLLLATPAGATTVRAKYTIFYLGLPVGDMETVKTFGVSTYQTSVDARVTGIATIISNFKMNMKSDGIIRKNVVQPNNFAAEETSSGEGQSMRMTLVGGSVKSAEIVPPIKDMDQRVPLLDEHKRNVVDPASSLVITAPSGQDPLGPSACNRTVRIFDGFSRSDYALEFVRTEELNTSGYKGEVAVCSVRYLPIAGHKPAASMTKFMQGNTGIEVRLAPIPDTQQLLLVSATIPLQVGTASFQIEQLQIEPAVAGRHGADPS
jgi:Protein of unknown function (DUF3108)